MYVLIMDAHTSITHARTHKTHTQHNTHTYTYKHTHLCFATDIYIVTYMVMYVKLQKIKPQGTYIRPSILTN